MKRDLTSLKRIIIISLLLTNSLFILYSQSLSLSGSYGVLPGSKQTYVLNPSYELNPNSIITWEVKGGSILFQVTDASSSSIYCIVAWNDSPGGYGYISFSESSNNGIIIKYIHITTYPEIVNEIITPHYYNQLNIDCSPINQPACNFLQNINFNINPPPPPYDPLNPFVVGNIPNWIATHGSPQIMNPWEPNLQPPVPATGFAYMYASQPVISGHPHRGEGIAQKLSNINYGSNYNLSFFVKFSQWTSGSAQLDEFYFVLVKCDDIDALPYYDHTLPPLPTNSQIIYHGMNVTNYNWQYITTSFTANDNYNMLWIFPKQSVGDAGFVMAYPVITFLADAANITPVGPITYYNQYETGSQVVLTASQSNSYQWLKNDMPIYGATSQTYTINMSGYSFYTDNYKCITSCGISNTVIFNYIGCLNESGYPVTIPPYGTCISNYPLSIVQPDMGNGAEYYWDTYHNPSCYYFTDIQNIYDNTALFHSGCTGGIYPEDIFTRAVATNGAEIRMRFGATANPFCKPLKNKFIDPYHEVDVVSIYPNPSKDFFVINSHKKIVRVEIFSITGALIKAEHCNFQNQATILLNDIPAGINFCRIYTETEIRNIKLIVSK